MNTNCTFCSMDTLFGGWIVEGFNIYCNDLDKYIHVCDDCFDVIKELGLLKGDYQYYYMDDGTITDLTMLSDKIKRIRKLGGLA